MDLQQSSVQDRRPQPGLALNLSPTTSNLASNNPFRRTISPAPLSSSSLAQSPSVNEDRRKSTNPFLDSYKVDAPAAVMPTRRSQSPHKPPNGLSLAPSSKQKEHGVSEMLIDLSLNDQPASQRSMQRRHPREQGSHPNGTHRTTASNEAKHDVKPGERAAIDIFESSGKRENRRPIPRRNSDSSMFNAKDEERRRKEHRRRERDGRGKDGKDVSDVKSRSSRSRRAQGLDIIDKLDVTGLYGQGMIHHDGPFDACNPHRNRKNVRAAPMHAFPEGSLNNALGGAGPVNKGIDYDAFHGQTVEGFTDYNTTTQLEDQYNHRKKPSRPSNEEPSVSWNPKDKIEPVHGEASAGLGTSTFFEGTAASRKERARRESESDNAPPNPVVGGLSRKRSIAQKIRGISQKRPTGGESAAVTSPEARYIQSPGSPQYIPSVQSAGGLGRLNEKNPFFQETTKPKPTVEFAPVPTTTAGGVGRSRTASSPYRTRDRAPSSPKRGLSRPATEEDQTAIRENPSGSGGNSNAGGGLMGRVKSLRSKKRPDRFTAPGGSG